MSSNGCVVRISVLLPRGVAVRADLGIPLPTVPTEGVAWKVDHGAALFLTLELPEGAKKATATALRLLAAELA